MPAPTGLRHARAHARECVSRVRRFLLTTAIVPLRTSLSATGDSIITLRKTLLLSPPPPPSPRTGNLRAVMSLLRARARARARTRPIYLITMLSAVMGEPAESGAAGDASNAIAAMRFASLLRAREIGGTPIRRYRLKRGEERSRLQARRYQRTSATRERPWRTRLAILSAKDSADEAVSRAVRSCALPSSRS